jgi:hypothetical protein
MNDSHVSFPFALLWFWFRRILWLWLLIGFFIFIIQIIECLIFQDNERIRLTLNFLEMVPDYLKNIVGGESLKAGNITGFIAIGYQHPLVWISYMIFAVCVPSGLLAGHVQGGTMEIILSHSVTKNQVYVCTCILTLVGILALVAVMFCGTVVGVNVCNFDQEISVWPFFRAATVGGLLSGAAAGVSLLTAASFRTRGRAVGPAISFLMVSYFIDIIAQWWPRAQFLGPASMFYYINPQKILMDTAWPLRDICVLGSIIIVTIIAGGIIWNRRDLPL